MEKEVLVSLIELKEKELALYKARLQELLKTRVSENSIEVDIKFRINSTPSKVFKVLKDANKPLSAREIGKKINTCNARINCILSSKIYARYLSVFSNGEEYTYLLKGKRK